MRKPVWEDVRAVLDRGRKRRSARTGCGSCSHSSQRWDAAAPRDNEARAYLEHPLLGPRLLDCCKLLIQVHAGSARDVFGDIDAMKLRSSLMDVCFRPESSRMLAK